MSKKKHSNNVKKYLKKAKKDNPTACREHVQILISLSISNCFRYISEYGSMPLGAVLEPICLILLHDDLPEKSNKVEMQPAEKDAYDLSEVIHVTDYTELMKYLKAFLADRYTTTIDTEIKGLLDQMDKDAKEMKNESK